MSNAKRDENNRPTVICASDNDGTTIVPIVADPNLHTLRCSDDVTGVDNGNNDGNAILDENSVPVWTALSSDGSGDIIEVYGDSITGAVLVDSQ